MPFGFIVLKIFNYLAFQSFDFERTWWKLFQKRTIGTNVDIYVFISANPRKLESAEINYTTVIKYHMQYDLALCSL
jgi:hypothetical protein